MKFVFHEGLDTYYAQLINTETEEVIREIPSKKVLDVFYEMQKLVGMIVDKKFSAGRNIARQNGWISSLEEIICQRCVLAVWHQVWI